MPGLARARVLSVLCALFLLASQATALDSSSPNFRNTRSSVDNGGERKTSTSYRLDSAAGVISTGAANSASYAVRDGVKGMQYYPARIADLWGSSGTGAGSVYLQWTAPGNDGDESSTSGGYVVRYSSIAARSPAASDADFEAATDASAMAPAPAARGALQTMTLTGLVEGVSYYFAIKAKERDGLRSVLSNGATAQATLSLGCVVTRNVHAVDGPYTTIQAAVNALPSSLSGHSCVIVNDGATYVEQVAVRDFTNNGSSITIAANPSLGLTPFVDPPSASTAAFVVMNASVNIAGIGVRPNDEAVDTMYGVYASSAYVKLSSVNVDAGGANVVALAGVRLSSWNTVEHSSVTVGAAHGFWLDGSTGTAISYSTAANDAAARYALYLQGASSNSFISLRVSNINNSGTGVSLSEADANVFGELHASAGGSGTALELDGDRNIIRRSTITSSASTALLILSASSSTVVESYIQGSTAVHVSGSSDTSIGSSRLLALGAGGSALAVSGSVGLTISSSTLTAGTGARSAAATIGYGNAGLIRLSTNTLTAGQYGLSIATQSAGAAIWIASNTINQIPSSSFDTMALHVNGLQSGATVQNNDIAITAAGSQGAGTAYFFYVQSGAGLVIERNRARNSNLVTAGSVNAVRVLGGGPLEFRYNDVYSKGDALTNAHVVRLTNSAIGVQLKSNSFAADHVAGGVDQLINVALNSQSGFVSDYNDWFSSSTFEMRWGGSIYSALAGWQSGSGRDPNSISADPLWKDPGAGDFHPKSIVGRWNPAAQAFEADAVASPTIDAGDPAHAFANEPAPNGGRVNQGSYGNTAEASKSAPVPANVQLAGIWMSSAAVSYTGVSASGYVLQASTDSIFRGVVHSSASPTEASPLTVTALDPNSTYYMRLGALWGQTTVYSPTVISTMTWAQLVSGTTVYQINVTSMVVNWVPLAAAPPDASSNSAAGYVLYVSSRSDFAPLWTSSVSWSVVQSTLTVDGLRGGVTYYFRVGSINGAGAVHYQNFVSTLMPIQLGVEMTTHTISLPGLTNMASEIVITTSTILTNTGNVKETYWLRVTTVTAGSPWFAGSAAGVDRYVVWTVVDPAGGEPAAGDFTSEDVVLDAETACSAAIYSKGAGTCVTVPVGGARKLWFKLGTPLATSTAAPQEIRIYARAVPDPYPDPNP